MSFFEKLEKRVNAVNSLVCIGLDPHFSQLGTDEPTAAIAEKFCMDIITATSDSAAAYKPNSAFFEAFGAEGFQVLKRVIQAIPHDIPVILDNKRGDIDTTAQAYAISSYDYLNADATTLNPYMGWDSVQPFVTGKYSNRGTFVLCKTSNPTSSDIQKLSISSTQNQNIGQDQLVYEKVASLCQTWSNSLDTPGNLGVVVGATDTTALSKIRQLLPTMWILCPGVGAQGGDVKSVCEAGLRGSDGSGILINVSRSISSASDKTKAAKELRDDINQYRNIHTQKQQQQLISQQKVTIEESSSSPTKKSKLINPNNDITTGNLTTTSSSTSISIAVELETYQREFIEFSIKKNVLQFGTFKLKSGRLSPYFFNAGLFSCGQSLHCLGQFYAKAIHKSNVQFDVIFGPAYKGIPLAAAVSMGWFQLYGENKDFSYNRKEVKDHGEGGLLVGANMKNRRVLVVDDVITAGTAIRESVNILQQIEAILVGVAVCLDRQEKTSDTNATSAIQQVIAECNVPVMSVIQLKHLVTHIEAQSQVAQQSHSSTVTTGAAVVSDDLVTRIQEYRKQYGVEY